MAMNWDNMGARCIARVQELSGPGRGLLRWERKAAGCPVEWPPEWRVGMLGWPRVLGAQGMPWGHSLGAEGSGREREARGGPTEVEVEGRRSQP